MSSYASYISFKKRGERPSVAAFCFAETLDDVESWKKEAQEQEVVETKSADPANDATAPPTSFEKQLVDLMSRSKESLLAYRSLISLNSAIPSAIVAATAEHSVLGFAKNELDLISECENYATYGVNDGAFVSVSRVIAQFNELKEGVAVIPGSVMLSLVATFDSLMSDFMKLLLKQQPNRFVGSEKTVAIKDVLSMSSFDELIEKLIDDEVDQIMRGSHSDQVKYIEANFKINIREHYERWPEFIEIFERRNLVAHGNCVANKTYISNCRAANVDVSKLSIGDTLDLSSEYLRDSVSVLAEFAMLSVFAIGLKMQPDSRDALYDHINYLTFELIRTRRPKLASRLLDFALNKQKPNVSDSAVKMMIVNFVNALKKSGQEARAAQVLDATDWTAASDNYKICVAALRNNVPEFVSLMQSVKHADTVKAADFREWPVFDWVRNEVAFQAEFQRLFGEPLLKAPSNEPKHLTSEMEGAVRDEGVAPSD